MGGVGGASKSSGAGGAGGADGGGGGASVTIPGLDTPIMPGTVITEEMAQAIVEASGGNLRIEDGAIVGENPDGSGPVHIPIGQPVSEGQVHDLHHTVPGSGGAGKG
jgi:Xaa-Pro aminopeptidase